MTRMPHSVSMFAVFGVLFALLAAPAFAIANSSGDGARKVTGAGFVLMVSLQRNSA